MSDPTLLDGPAPTASAAIARYEAIRDRLPQACFPAGAQYRAHLEELADEFDCFVLDGFGVLNIGAETVPGAVERVLALKAMGKQVRVLTNGASFPVSVTRAKYQGWGLEFAANEVVSSRDALARELALHQDKCWGFAALEKSALSELADNHILLGDDPADYDRCDGFVLLGTGNWSSQRQQLLSQALAAQPRPVLTGNPDLVAPQPGGLSREAGLYAHALADAGLAEPEFFGKPFDNAFALIRETLSGIDPQRIAMVGDTLHTDILGGAQAGWRTVLVTGHGLLKGLDAEHAIESSGIRPDFIVPTT
ncbi:HAD-IIA family hydrolase [Granulosicoccaceae sp. 1_MG-2023]|nr:HAD-IIA family hydrolase [Granulosicoccaceae sp. 1_MG-2023]